MKPADWDEILAPSVPWQDAYAIVEREVRAFILATPAGRVSYLTTDEVVSGLYPEQFAKKEGVTARKRLYKALAALATKGLADCVTRGEPRRLGNTKKMIRPWLWHAPVAKEPAPSRITAAEERARIVAFLYDSPWSTPRDQELAKEIRKGDHWTVKKPTPIPAVEAALADAVIAVMPPPRFQPAFTIGQEVDYAGGKWTVEYIDAGIDTVRLQQGATVVAMRLSRLRAAATPTSDHDQS